MIRNASKLKIIFALVVVCGFSLTFLSPAQAQEKEDVIRPITAAGSAAFMFTIQGLAPFNIGGPGLGTVKFVDSNGSIREMSLTGAGIKYFLSDGLALRFALGLQTHSSGADTLPGGALSATAFGVAAGAEMHFRPLYSTSPYVGAQVSFASGSSTTTNKGTGSTETSTESTGSSSSLGVGAFAGFDWFFTRGIAVGAEVGLGFSSNSSSSKSGSNAEVDNPSVSGIALTTDGEVHFVVFF